MLKYASIFFLSAVLIAIPALAAQPGPYAGEEQREIKALSPQEIQQYLAGKGMGLARAAELNHYPGPMHVLELAGPLGLSAEQKRHTQAVFTAMQAGAKRQGAMLVEKERTLDRLFADGTITPEKLQSLLVAIAGVQAEIRRIHLAAHLEQKKILTAEQVTKYNALRGYAAHAGHAHRH